MVIFRNRKNRQDLALPLPEEIMEELAGEESEEGSIEVLGFTEENSQIFDNKFLIVVIALVVAAVGGLFLSFVIRGRT